MLDSSRGREITAHRLPRSELISTALGCAFVPVIALVFTFVCAVILCLLSLVFACALTLATALATSPWRGGSPRQARRIRSSATS